MLHQLISLMIEFTAIVYRSNLRWVLEYSRYDVMAVPADVTTTTKLAYPKYDKAEADPASRPSAVNIIIPIWLYFGRRDW